MKMIISVLAACFLFAGQVNADVYVGEKRKILTLGDSLTYGTGDASGNLMGFRDHLSDLLGTTNWEFIGTSVRPQSASGYRTNHSGYPSLAASQTVTYVASELAGAFGNSVPSGSVVVLFIGTNDIARSVGNSTVTGYLSTILDSIRTFNSGLRVILINLGPNGTGAVETRMVSYNTAFATMLGTYQATYPTFDIDLIDMHSSIANDTHGLCGGAGNWQANCYADTTHFNNTGYRAVAKQIAACINDPNATNCDGTP